MDAKLGGYEGVFFTLTDAGALDINVHYPSSELPSSVKFIFSKIDLSFGK